MMSDFAPPSVSEMFAYAYGAHRSGEWSATAKRQEALVEHCMYYALQLESEGQALVQALGLRGHFLRCSRQNIANEGRPDLEIQTNRERFTVELKLEATLTRGQKKEGYASYFIVPSGRLKALKRTLPKNQRTICWEQLLHTLRNVKSEPTLLIAACELAIASAHPFIPLPHPKCLTSQDAMSLLDSWVDTTQRFTRAAVGQPLMFNPSSLNGNLHILRRCNSKERTYGVRLDLTRKSEPTSIASYYRNEDYSVKRTDVATISKDLQCDKSAINEIHAEITRTEWTQECSDIGRYVEAFFDTADRFIRSKREIAARKRSLDDPKICLDPVSISAEARIGQKSVSLKFTPTPFSKGSAPFMVGKDRLTEPKDGPAFRTSVHDALTKALL